MYQQFAVYPDSGIADSADSNPAQAAPTAGREPPTVARVQMKTSKSLLIITHWPLFSFLSLLWIHLMCVSVESFIQIMICFIQSRSSHSASPCVSLWDLISQWSKLNIHRSFILDKDTGTDIHSCLFFFLPLTGTSVLILFITASCWQTHTHTLLCHLSCRRH